MATTNGCPFDPATLVSPPAWLTGSNASPASPAYVREQAIHFRASTPSAFLPAEFNLGRLEVIEKHLWLAGRAMPARPIHAQKGALKRNIVLTEQLDMHILWQGKRIFLKPLPSHNCACACGGKGAQKPLSECSTARFRSIAIGFVLSWVSLIQYESDLSIAQKEDLLPNDLSWTFWHSFASQFMALQGSPGIHARWIYGELRLHRINWIYRLLSRHHGGNLLRGYSPEYREYRAFVENAFAYFLAVFGVLSIILDAFEVALGTDRYHASGTFQNVSGGFAIFAVVAVLAIPVSLISTSLYKSRGRVVIYLIILLAVLWTAYMVVIPASTIIRIFKDDKMEVPIEPDSGYGLDAQHTFKDIIKVSDLPSNLIPQTGKHRKPGRLVVVGDVHGMKNSLVELLKKIKFEEKHDHLIMAGDMISKGPDSAGVVDLAMKMGATGVRGNHEDRIILAYANMLAEHVNVNTPGPYEDTERKQDAFEKENLSGGDYKDRSLAKALGKERIKWLQSCPVILRVGQLGDMGEVVVVHAGLTPGVKLEQQDPTLVMNMRTIGKDGIPSDTREGTVWTKAWNKHQKSLPKRDRKTVIYGHDSKRGLKIKKYSVGIDTGCLKGGKLSAVVIEGGHSNHSYKLVHVNCEDVHTMTKSKSSAESVDMKIKKTSGTTRTIKGKGVAASPPSGQTVEKNTRALDAINGMSGELPTQLKTNEKQSEILKKGGKKAKSSSMKMAPKVSPSENSGKRKAPQVSQSSNLNNPVTTKRKGKARAMSTPGPSRSIKKLDHISEEGRSVSVPVKTSVDKHPQPNKTKAKAIPASSSPQQIKLQLPPLAEGVEVNPKLRKRFYEALILLAVFGKNRGDRTAEEGFESGPDPSELDNDKLRRSFIRHLAYLCDYETGGDSCSAIALQQTPVGIVYWLASNKSRGVDHVVPFLGDILCRLGTARQETIHQLEAEIFEKSVGFSSARILRYSNNLKQELDFVLECPEIFNKDQGSTLISWLKKLKAALTNPQALCRLCHDSRSSEEYARLQTLSRHGTSCAGRFEKMRYTIGRLNHTMKAIKVLISTSFKHPHLFQNFSISRARSSRSLKPPLIERNPKLVEIAGRMTSDPTEIDKYRAALTELDHRFSLSDNLHHFCNSNGWRLKVHAELILLDLFWTQKFDFVDADRYIGCSKPACYCCFHYIKAHPGKFVIPACHNNFYENWRTPDIFNAGDETAIRTRRNILIEMSKIIRRDVWNQIAELRGPNHTKKPDSMTEMSSVRRGVFGVDFGDEGGIPSKLSQLGEDDREDLSDYDESMAGSDGSLADEEDEGKSQSRSQSQFASESEDIDSDEDDDGGVVIDY
ncbi:hypothetical protein B7494_g8342 [Chlorociboria aeruginascens]|nr:hypothetical protein B7494_g8342 [Chlorociboria aeruginascens]